VRRSGVAIAMAALRSGVSGARLADFTTVTHDGEIVARELRPRASASAARNCCAAAQKSPSPTRIVSQRVSRDG